MLVSRYDDDRDMVCGNCRHHKLDSQKNRFCGCRKSVKFRTQTKLRDSCQEWDRGSQIIGGMVSHEQSSKKKCRKER